MELNKMAEANLSGGGSIVKYGFWNNKGGTGKTSLAFQAISMFAERNPEDRILTIDLCPQGNLSELFLGGLIGGGAKNLKKVHDSNSSRCSIGGYFEKRLPTPYQMSSAIDVTDFICNPSEYNDKIPHNIDLVTGDPLVELQATTINTIANVSSPTFNAYLSVIDWVNDFMESLNEKYDHLFIDMNPSFSIYTQIALAGVDRLILPVMADDSSRRAVENAIALVHGINLPSPIYENHTFSSLLERDGRKPARFHLVPKNRLTQYMGDATAYGSVLSEIDSMVSNLIVNNPNTLTFRSLDEGVVSIRDFGTTGVVSFAYATPFTKLKTGNYNLPGKEKPTQVNKDYIAHCVEAMNNIVDKIV